MTGDGIEYQSNGIPSAYSDSSSMADSSDAEQPKVNDLCWGEYRDFYNVRFTENWMDSFYDETTETFDCGDHAHLQAEYVVCESAEFVRTH